MARTLISSSPFIGTSLSSETSRHGFLHSLPHRTRLVDTRVKFSIHEIPSISSIDSVDLSEVFTKAESFLYTLADATVSTAPDAAAPVEKNGGWFGFISDAMEVVLKVLKDGLATLHVPYSYGFAIILLTVLVKVVTYPLTKQQVESTLAMQNLQPKIKAIQERYAGNQERVQLETSRLYRQAGVNPLAGCLPTLATIPVWIGLYQALSNVANEDGHPPLGWHDTAAYLVLPVLLVVSQYVSMELMKPPQVATTGRPPPNLHQRRPLAGSLKSPY
ncbi:hypothetical protein Cgig2_003958 [Carnegiea gigantea]|uniref:Membrane insertase YidC/Oxa/ALB C-terminal domain-containing protein n=1 Tax=Carnegiea gigantea TaxID=171969 RepID=A0A9Q1KBM4_9CARY|nr:hypothetical protein Cgig2_003958 [Carnegiea gigantea]